MQSKAFSRIQTAFIVIATLVVFYWIAIQAADKVPLRLPDASAPTSATSTTFVAPSGRATIEVRAPNGVIHTIISSTTIDRELGLGGFDPLPTDAGMIFMFPSAGPLGFWMKDMRFALDIIWIGTDKRVTGLARAVSPDSYPNVFYSSGLTQYVLELDSGGAEKWGIATGTQLVF
jgi:uncharacterized membrane protein (UPF0127 family)